MVGNSHWPIRWDAFRYEVGFFKGLRIKWVLAIASSLASVFMVAGGSFAMFTASAKTNSQTFTSGTINLNDSNGLIWSHKIYFSNLAPGDSGTLTMNADATQVKNNTSIR